MSTCSALDLIRQLDNREAFIRSEVRELIVETIADEVTALCGPAYQPSPDSPYRRGGSEAGSIVLDGRRGKVRRPRVVREDVGGRREERLASYEASRNGDHVRESILRAMVAGVPSRDQTGLPSGLSCISERGLPAVDRRGAAASRAVPAPGTCPAALSGR